MSVWHVDRFCDVCYTIEDKKERLNFVIIAHRGHRDQKKTTGGVDSLFRLCYTISEKGRKTDISIFTHCREKQFFCACYILNNYFKGRYSL